ncbi:MAG: protein kinase [Enhygromyxa sp.]
MLLERLGAGGMGVVFAAWDPELERRVAIKLISDRKPDLHRQLRARLKREAQAMARLRHPNVVAVYDVGEADGRLFVAMEYVEGVSLRQWLQASERSGPEIVEVFRAAGEGLAAAHAHGVVHRDFKPDNVLIARDARVLVLDFGLASWASSSSSHPIELEPAEPQLDEAELAAEVSSGSDERDEPPERERDSTVFEAVFEPSSSGRPSELLETNPGNLTMPGAVIGTPAYMAPEQHRGQPTDARSDQFSFCAALWEALTGKLPFGRGPLLLARARSARLGGSFERRDLPASVEKALRQGLAWSPEQRWPEMRALLDALLVKPRKRRWPVVLVLVLGLGLLLGLAAAQLRGDPKHASAAALCDDGQARMARIWSEARADELALALGHRSRLAERSWPYLQAELDRWGASWIATDRDLCLRYGRIIGVEGGVRHEQLACLDRQLGHLEQLVEVLTTLSEDEIDKSFDLLATLPNPQSCRDVGRSPVIERKVDELLPALPDAAERAELDSAMARAELELSLSRLDRVDELSAALFERTRARGLEPQHARVAKLRAQLMVVRRQAGLAIDVALAGLEAAERAGDPALRLDALLEVADVHASASDTIAAGRWLRQAQALAGELVLDRAARARLATIEAHVAMTDGRFAEALAAWDRALAATVPKQDRFAYIERLHSRATVLFMAGQAAEGLQQLRRAEQMYGELVGPSHAGVLGIRMDIAHALETLGELEQSREAYLAVADELEAALGGPSDLSIAARSHAAAQLARLGDCEGALTEFEPLMGLARELMAYPSAVLGNLLRRRTALCRYATPEAVDYARQTVALYREALTDQHASTAATHAELGIALLVAGEPAEAKLAAARAIELFEIVDPEREDQVALPRRHAAQAVLLLAAHALGEAGALDGGEALLVELPESSLLRERLAQLLP